MILNKIQRKLVEGKALEIINNKFWNAIVGLIRRFNRFVNKGLKKVDSLIAYFPRRSLSKKTEIQNNTIMFLTYQGDYTCNPRAIADEILRQKLPYKLIWVVKKDTDRSAFPKRIKFVLRGSFEFYRAAAAARIFIDNTHDLPRLGVHKKEGQILFQTWHGSLGIKRLDGDVVMNRRWKWLRKVCRKETDYCISNSAFEDNVFQTSYWPDVPTLSFGHARNDILFTKKQRKLQAVRERICDTLNILPEQKICLYAPTHKDNVHESFSGLDYSSLKNSLEKRFSGDWIIALRFHSRLKKKHQQWLKQLPPYVIDATDYGDIQELLLVTDVGITDYSSWIFDYILLERPGFILADDIDTFEKQRSFYYPLESTPFPIALNEQQLSENIENFDETIYKKNVHTFLRERGCIEDGHASQRIVETIKDMMTNS